MERPNQNTYMYIRWFVIRMALILFDIFAVNIAYYAALLIRFYVAFEFNIWAVKYVPAFFKFAPWYTVCCLIVFCVFKLYNSMWKYAGLNDMSRILKASVVTCAIQIAGSLAFVMRMPITYYVIGAVIQFTLIALSRFSYRLFLVEWNRLRKNRNKTAINVMIVGVGETSRIMLKHLERDPENAANPVCLVNYRGNEFGDILEGVPVIGGVDNISAAIQKYGVENVILADSIMPDSVKKHIREICREKDVNVQEFGGYFQNFYGSISLRNLLEYTNGTVELVTDGKQKTFTDAEQALMSMTGKYVVNTISAKDNRLVIGLQKDILRPNDIQEAWVQNYKEETGEDISFF